MNRLVDNDHEPEFRLFAGTEPECADEPFDRPAQIQHGVSDREECYSDICVHVLKTEPQHKHCQDHQGIDGDMEYQRLPAFALVDRLPFVLQEPVSYEVSQKQTFENRHGLVRFLVSRFESTMLRTATVRGLSPLETVIGGGWRCRGRWPAHGYISF